MKVIIYILILSFSFIAQAHKYEAENMLVDHPWMKAFNNNGAGYFKIKNTVNTDIHLLEVVSDSVDNIELHTIIMEEDVAKMRPIKGGVIIKVGESMEFKPMGNHLMFFGINKKLGEGELLEANFKFKNSKDLLVKFKMESNKSSHNHEH
jgi:copper(I)-binding protein